MNSLLQPVSIEVGNNEHQQENRIKEKWQKNWINCEEKRKNTTKRNEIKKSESTRTKEMSNQDEVKKARTQIVKPKIFNLPRKTLSSYQTNILLCGLKFTATRNNFELKSNIQSYTCGLWLAEFFQNKESNDSEENLYLKKSTFTPPRNWNHQIYSLDNLNLENI